MLLRSLFFLLFSSQVLSAGITIDVDLDMTIDAIKYLERGLQDKALYAYLNIIEECPEPSEDTVSDIKTPSDLEAFLSASGFTLTIDKSYFDGSSLDSFVFNQDGTWTAYDDINRRLVRNWDEGCPHKPRNIEYDSDYENIHTVGIIKELKMGYFNSDTNGGIFNLGDQNNLAWLDTKPEGDIEKLFFVDDICLQKYLLVLMLVFGRLSLNGKKE